MIKESPKDELLSLIDQTQEQLSYLQELGVAGITLDRSPASEHTKPTEKLSTSPAAATAAAFETLPLPKPVGRVQERAPDSTLTTPQPDAPTLPQNNLFGDLGPQPEVIAKSAETLEEIWADVGDCTRCPLHQGRTNVVHTEGSRKARLMFVGEAPGADEDAQARPFVGRAGQLLTKIIESLGLKREEVLIGNVNRCRPPGNRPPTPDEAAMCKPFLLREIASVTPEAIVVLGNTAMRNLLEVKEGITKLRGQFQDYKGIKIMPTFHPAYLLRDPSKKRETWEDLKKVRDFLDTKAKK